jgi:hypothetical protein
MLKIPMLVKLSLCTLVMLGLASCGSSNSQPQSMPDSKPQSPSDKPPPKAPANVPQMRTQGGPSDVAPAPPKDAVYTIFCARLDGDMHVQRANRIKQELIDTTKMKDWYVIHENAQSLLYYGYYRVINDPKDPKETQRAQTDRKKIDFMVDPMGNRPFEKAVFVELTAPDPIAPPDWNLVNAKGAYSLQIAAYKDSPQRKEAAVETVRAARAQGIEAYYYHGASSSLVCVGAWPETAVKMTGGAGLDGAGPNTGASAAQGGNTDPEQPLMVLPQMKDEELKRDFTAAGKQANVKVVSPDVEIIDPTLKAAMLQYPYNAVNGMHIKHVVNGKEQYDPSLLVPIPRDANAIAGAQNPQNQPPSPAGMLQQQQVGATPDQPAYDPSYRPALPRHTPPPSQQPQPNNGRLKSIGG